MVSSQGAPGKPGEPGPRGERVSGDVWPCGGSLQGTGDCAQGLREPWQALFPALPSILSPQGEAFLDAVVVDVVGFFLFPFFLVVILRRKITAIKIQRQVFPDFDRSLAPLRVQTPVRDTLGAQRASLPGARFVPGGDRGTDFPIMNRLGT